MFDLPTPLLPVSGLRWNMLTLKDYKNLLANSSGHLKKCQTSKGHSSEFLICSVFCLFVFNMTSSGSNCQVLCRNNGVVGNDMCFASWMWSKQRQVSAWPTALTFSCWLLAQFHLQRVVSCVRWDVLKSRCSQVVSNLSSLHYFACPKNLNKCEGN